MSTLPLNFWLQNAHFIIYVLVALGFFASGWLYYDSYRQKTDMKILVRSLGFFVLVLWALLSSAGLDMNWIKYTGLGLELIGVGLLMAGFYMETIPTPPKEKSNQKTLAAVPAFSILKSAIFKLPILGWLAVFVRLWKFTKKGLTRDLVGLKIAVLFILLSRFVSIFDLFANSSNLVVFNLTRQYSYLWILEILLLLIGAIVLIKWAFYYLQFRIVPRLYIIFIATSVVIFVISTVVFTGFLFSASQKNNLDSLKKSGAVFEFSIKELQRQTELAAYSLAQRNLVIEGVVENNVDKTKQGLGDPIKELNVGGAVITNRGGETLAVAGSYIEVGESLVSDPAVIKTLEGKPTSSIVLEKLHDVNQMVVRSGYPIVVDAKVQGVSVVDFPVDQAFVDSIKELTTLDIALNSKTTYVAATFVDKNKRRISGTEITNKEVLKLIKENTKKPWVWSGVEKLVDQSYLTVYRSLADADDVNVGSLMVGHSRQLLISQTEQSIKLTFLATALLILLSLVPLYYLARSISKATKA